MAKPNEVELGDLVQDEVTSLKGIAYGITLWMHGCRRIQVQPQESKDGKPADTVSFDEPQLKILKRGVIKPTSIELGFTAPRASVRSTGGPMTSPTRHAEPRR